MVKKLNILILILLLGGGTLSAQHYVGVRGGWGGGLSRLDPKQETALQMGLYSGGISYKFYTAEKYVGGVQVDLQYMQKGYAYDMFLGSDTSYHRKINTVELPIMWQPHIYLVGRNARFFINLGVQFSYNIDSEEWYKSKTSGEFGRQQYKMITTRDNRLGYGLVGGAGLSFFIQRFEVAIEARYYFGLSDVLKNSTKFHSNPLRSPLDNLNGSIALYYRLGKEGIRAAPTASAALRMEQNAAKRAAKQENKKQKEQSNEQ